MANRPVYMPNTKTLGVSIMETEFKWFPGMSKSQKQKSVVSLHQAANEREVDRVLEISSKSELELGVHLSAFNLSLATKKYGRTLSVETAFQASKVFEKGGPYTDLLDKTSREAKTDIRLKESGNLLSFRFFQQEFPLEPKTYFYDWLYINALCENEALAEGLLEYSGFTDIEFNPKKSINCQAFSAAIYVSLSHALLLADAMISPQAFLEVLSDVYKGRQLESPVQTSLL